MALEPLLTIHLLGQFWLIYGDQLVTDINTPRLQALLAYLLIHRSTPVSRQKLAFLFWPDSSEEQARTNLRHIVHLLRGALPEANRFLSFDRHTLGWNTSAPYWLDIAELEQAAAQADSAEALQRVVYLYTGDLLPDLYHDWVLGERERLQKLFLNALERIIDILEAQGDFSQAIQYAQRLLRQDPLREDTYRCLMRLHARSGNPSGVISAYQACVDALRRDLGAEPGPETRQALRQFSASAAGELALHDTGFPPRRPTLRVPLTRLIGRENELNAIQAAVVSRRLVTLTGFGGVGKTRLALTTAHVLQGYFKAGVVWLDLAPISDPSQLVQAAVSVLNIPMQSEHDLNDLLVNFIGTKQMLLVLDNCEHVLIGVVQLLGLLLPGCPRLHLLATSRVSLNMDGEVVYTVLPLPVPELPQAQTESSLAALQSNESIQLFLERAMAVQPTLALSRYNQSAVVRICWQLDGIPLAIELAAACLRLLTPQQIADRLSDVLRLLARSGPAGLRRHQTLRATLDWSHDLLSAAEKTFLRRLAIFSGSFTLEAAEAVCSDGELKTDSVIGLVAALIDHSLLSVEITASEARYRLHEVTRQYALEKLVEAGEVELMRARHLDYYCNLAEQAEPLLRRSEQVIWLHRLDQETDNLRAALRWATRQGRAEEAQMALRMAGALWLYWYIRCHWDEGLRWSEAVLQASQPLPILDALRVKVLNAVASFSLYMGELESATQHARACLSASQRAGDLEGMILSLHQLGLIAMRKVGLGTPGQYLQAGLDLARQIEDPWLVSFLLGDLGLLARIQENWQLSREFYQQQLEVSRANGDRYTRCFALILLADIALHLDDLTQAGEYIRLGLELAREMGNMRAQAACLSNDALLAFQAGQYDRTGQLLREVLNINWEIRDRENTIETLWKIAKLLTEQGQVEKAARLLAAGLAMWSNLKFDIQYFKEIDLELLRKRLRAALGERAFTAAWTAGELMDLEQAVHLAGIED